MRQLRYFTVLADELHFRRAAERLNITQAPLSVAIQRLEAEIGGQLFHRTQRRVALTEVGQVFREHAKATLERLDRGLAEVREIASGHAGRLQIGFTSASSLLSFFPEIISAFRRRYSAVDVTLREISSSAQLIALRNREIDIGIVRGHKIVSPSDISLARLLRDPLMAAMRHDHEFASRESLTLADLRGTPLIFYPAKSGVGIYEHFIRACERRGFTPEIVQEASEASTMVGLAGTGLGIAIVPAELRCIHVPNVVFRPIDDDDAVTELVLACRAGEQSALVAQFRHLVQVALVARPEAATTAATGGPIDTTPAKEQIGYN
ncbi:LysR substrate-binding domain-containing protein [Sphingomonas bacterium]|uniref:LysR substrate-binding domain-containing protein n=1 Tax=Sphingomonas bacterium TaxID=1895847 RepID=UPI001575893A|nr:LysR substrate-binding domain-containing protein [Sphingomonas bacterium]